MSARRYDPPIVAIRCLHYRYPLASACLGALAVAGCVVDVSGDEAVSTTYPSPSSPVPEEFVDLALLMPAQAPRGYVWEPDEVAGAGPLDLEAAALDEGRGDSAEFLGAAGFEGGYQRRYVTSLRDRRIDIWVYRFAFGDSAAGQVLRDVDAAPVAAEPILLSTVEASAGWRRARPDESIVRVVFAAGPYFVRIEASDPEAAAAVESARAIAEMMDGMIPRISEPVEAVDTSTTLAE